MTQPLLVDLSGLNRYDLMRACLNMMYRAWADDWTPESWGIGLCAEWPVAPPGWRLVTKHDLDRKEDA